MDNRIVKEAASLSEKKYREKLGLFLVEGNKLVREAIDRNRDISAVFVRSGCDSDAYAIAEDAEAKGISVFELTSDVFLKLVKTETPQGIAASVALKGLDADDFAKAIDEKSVLVLDRLQDPGNVGTLIRTAEAMGFGGVVAIKGTADPFQPKVVRSAAGSILRLPLLSGVEESEAQALFKKMKLELFASDADESAISCTEADLSGGIALVIGNEGGGVSEFFKTAGTLLMIPMEGELESLNAAVAGSLIMYESKRQKGLKDK